MSIIQPDSIKAIAHSVDITRLSDDAARTLAPDVEYRLREVVQEALKFAKHAKRTKLTTEDINNALRLRNVEPVYGFNSKDPAKFLRVAPNSELMYVQDPEVSFNQLIETALPKLPRIPGVTAHWLAINGMQPDLPENVSAGPLPKKRRQPLGLPGQGGRMGSLQEAAAAAAAAAVAGLDPSLPAAGDSAAASAAGGAARLGASASSAAGQHQQQLLLGAGGGAVGPSPRSIAGAAVQLQLPLRHAVSRELQVYWDRIVDLLLAPAPQGALSGFVPAAAGSAGAAAGGGSGGAQSGGAAAAAGADKQAVLTRALASVASDPGLHPLVPYMCAFIADGVKQHLMNLTVLHRLLLLTRALLANPDVHLAPYLQQLLPAVTTCIVTKTLGSHPSEDHWTVRREAAALLSTIARQFAAPHHNLQPRLCRVLAQALLDADKPLTSKYGAVVGLQALGPQVVRTLLIPHLEPFMSAVLIPAMTAGAEPDIPPGTANGSLQAQQQQQALQRQLRQQAKAEAWQVYGALLSAVGSAMYDLVIGYMRGRLSVQLVLARPGGAEGSSWQEQYTQTLLAAKRRAAQQQQHQQAGVQSAAGQDLRQQQQGAGTGAAAGGAGSSQASTQTHRQQHGAADGRAGLKGPPALLQCGRQGPVGAAAAGDGGGDVAVVSEGQQPSVAEVLGQSWREDSDVNATLGALLSLFGEDLLPCLPLPELAAVSL